MLLHLALVYSSQCCCGSADAVRSAAIKRKRVRDSPQGRPSDANINHKSQGPLSNAAFRWQVHALAAGPTWSSTGSEGCVAATEQACAKICSRLRPHLQQKGTGWATWQATVGQVQDGSALTPASVMLSAYGFYDGTRRDKNGRTGKGKASGFGPALGLCPGRGFLHPAQAATLHHHRHQSLPWLYTG